MFDGKWLQFLFRLSEYILYKSWIINRRAVSVTGNIAGSMSKAIVITARAAASVWKTLKALDRADRKLVASMYLTRIAKAGALELEAEVILHESALQDADACGSCCGMSGGRRLVHLAGIFEPDPMIVSSTWAFMTGHPAQSDKMVTLMAGASWKRPSRHASAMSLHRRWRSAVVPGAPYLTRGPRASGRDLTRALCPPTRSEPGESTRGAGSIRNCHVGENYVASAAFERVVAEIPLKRQVSRQK
jgi:hypothetical protein